MIKTLNKMGTEGNYLNVIKAICDKHTDNIILNSKNLKSVSVCSEEDKDSHSPHFF